MSFQHALQLYNNKHYPLALQSLTQAIELDGKHPAVCELRAAVLEKLGRYKEALQDARSVIELLPESHKGYIRASRLFALLNKNSQAHKMLSLGLPFCPPDLRQSLAPSLSALANKRDAQSLALQRSNRNHIDHLPYEIVSEIVRYLVADNCDAVLRLAGISRGWRAFCMNNRAAWGNLRLGKKRPVAKVGAFLKRSEGRLKELWIDEVDSTSMSKILPLLDGRLREVRVLSVRLPREMSVNVALLVFERWQGQFHPGVLNKVKVEFAQQVPSWEGESTLVWGLMGRWTEDEETADESRVCALESIKLKRTPILSLPPPSTPIGSLTSLKTLHLSEFNTTLGFSCRNLTHLLRQTTNLEDLVVLTRTMVRPFAPAQDTPDPGQDSLPIDLPKLHSLTLDFHSYNPAQRLTIDHPSLKKLRLLSSTGGEQSFEENQYEHHLFCRVDVPAIPPVPLLWRTRPKPVAATLTHLIMTRTPIINESLFVNHLHSLPSLQVLLVGGCNLTNKTLEALLLEQDGARWVCPQLENVDLSYSLEITGSPLCRMVASRIPPSSPSTSTLPPSTDPAPKATQPSFQLSFKPTKRTPSASSLPPPLPQPNTKPSFTQGPEKIAIKHLILDGCSNIEPKAIDWLRTKVKQVQFKVVNPTAGTGSFVDSVRRRSGL